MNSVFPSVPAPTFNIRADGGYIYGDSISVSGLMVAIWAFRGMTVQNLVATATMQTPPNQGSNGLFIESFGLAQILGGSLTASTIKLNWDQLSVASLSVRATMAQPFRQPNLVMNVLSNMTSQNNLSVSAV